MAQESNTLILSESHRLEMHLKFKDVLGEKVAEIVMEHLPPSGWADVARKPDVHHLTEIVDLRFAHVEARLNGIAAGLWTIGAISSACFVGLFTLIATKL
jgi:hypothetical protein